MDEKRIGEIIRKVYAQAKKSCVSEAKNALATHVEEEIFKSHKESISYKTVERAFKRHVFKDKTVSESNPESINLFCKYLGYQDYLNYIRKSRRRKWTLIINISIVFGAILTTILILDNLLPNILTPNKQNVIDKNICMTWADSLYVTVSCDKGPFSKYGTKVKPLNQIELKNMRKVEVNAAYRFFSEDEKPLIWYYKNKDDAYEYFTAPGLHPTTGETLRKITHHIIQTYVPMHLDKKESFIPE